MKRHYYYATAFVSITATLLFAQDFVPDTTRVDTAKKSAQVPATRGEDLIKPDSGNAIKTKPTQGAQQAIPATKIRTKEELRAKYSVEEIRLKEDGSLHTILGNIQVSSATGDLEKDAITFLNEVAPLFGYDDVMSEYRMHSKYSDAIEFQQYFDGVPVLNGSINLYSWEQGVINNVIGNYVRGISISATPALDSTAAGEIARVDIGTEDSVIINERKLWIKEQSDGFHLVWSLRAFQSRKMTGFEYDVDAHSGSILRKSSSGVH